MSAVIAALAMRPRLVLAGAAAVIAGTILAAVYLAGRGDGADAQAERTAHQDQRAEDAGDEAKRAVRWCADTGGRWDVATGRCD